LVRKRLFDASSMVDFSTYRLLEQHCCCPTPLLVLSGKKE